MDNQQDWRCCQCGRLLGKLRGNRIHIKLSRSHEYVVAMPASGICRGCGTLNESPDRTNSTASER